MQLLDSRECSNEEEMSLSGSETSLRKYILLSREERTAHIDLTTDCDLSRSVRPARRHILDSLGVTNDVDNWKTEKIEFCHLCECHSRNGWCSNPEHVYLGTTRENKLDQPLEVLVESGRRMGKMERTDETRQKMSVSASARTDDRGASKRIKSVCLERVEDGEVFTFSSRGEAAESLGINRGNLSSLLTGKRKTCQGYRVHF